MDPTIWFSLHWFSDAFSQFEWEDPQWLFGIYFVPLIWLGRYILLLILGRKAFAVSAGREAFRASPFNYIRHLHPLILAITLCLVLVSLARPQLSSEHTEHWSEGIDIVLTIDISESMQIEDFLPTRLEAAKEVAMDFVNGRFQDRIGLVVFSGEAFSKSPLTTDYDMIKSQIKEIDFSLIQVSGTAIGSALAVGVNRLRESDSKSKVIILLSDGDNTAGNLDPILSARLAAAHDVRIYCVAIGKEGKVPMGKDIFGRTRYVENSLDETNLREISRIGNGRFYRVSSQRMLEKVFTEIDSLEKVEILETRYRETTDYYPVYLKWSGLMLLLWLMLKPTFLASPISD